MSLSAHDELLMLRKRARRRLVGAIVLVLVATTVLWNVLDALPEQEMKPEQVEISGLPASAPTQAPVAPPPVAASAPQETDILATLPPEDSVLAPPPAAEASRPQVVAPVVAPAAQAAVAPPVEPKPVVPKPVEPKPTEPKPTDKKPEPVVAQKKPAPDPAAILEGREAEAPRAAASSATAEKYQVQLAALSDADKISALKQRLSAVGVAARFSKVQTSKGEVTRVRVGPFGSRAEADAALRKLERAGVSGIIVTK